MSRHRGYTSGLEPSVVRNKYSEGFLGTSITEDTFVKDRGPTLGKPFSKSCLSKIINDIVRS